MKWVIVACAIALAGCETKSVDEMSYTEVKQYAGELMERCRAQGAAAGNEMQMCINQEARADEMKRRKAIQTRRQIGAAIAAGADGYARGSQANRSVNCTSTGYGNTVRTTCY